MVLTEAFAAGTPVIASAIAGYSDVVTDGVDGVLVPPGDPQRLAEELQRAYHEPERLAGDGRGGAPQRRALRLAAGRRPGDRGLRAGDRGAGAGHAPARGSPHWAGLRPADGDPPAPGRAAALARPAAGPERQAGAPSPDGSASAWPALLGVGLTALAAQKIGVDNVVESIVHSDADLGPDRLRADGALPLLPRRLLVLDRRARRCPTGPSVAATSPRRR